MTEQDKRILVVRPGDVLILKNLGELAEEGIPDFISGINKLSEAIGVKVFAFSDDIDVSTLPHEDLERIYIESAVNYVKMKDKESPGKDK